MPQSWSIIILCYNEKDTATHVISKTYEVLKKISPQTYEIVIIDDGSTDGSYDVIKKFIQKKHHVKCIRHSTNQGIGKALRCGYANAKNENICVIPGDNQFDPNELLAVPVIPQNTFVSFYRKDNTTYSLSRNALSFINKLINAVFLGIRLRDVNWVKVYKRNELKTLPILLTSSLVESEICAKLLLKGNSVKEIESQYLKRTHGVSKGASLKIVLQALGDCIKLIWIIRKPHV